MLERTKNWHVVSGQLTSYRATQNIEGNKSVLFLAEQISDSIKDLFPKMELILII